MKNSKISGPKETDANYIELQPITGDFNTKINNRVSTKNATYVGPTDLHVQFDFKLLDFCEQFDRKQSELCDMIEDGDGFTKEEIHDLVLTANKAVWQKSHE